MDWRTFGFDGILMDDALPGARKLCLKNMYFLFVDKIKSIQLHSLTQQ